MYLERFGFSDKPFRLTPDPRYFFPSDQHRRALAYLEYGLHEGEGFIVVTGEPGTGKSTLVSKLMEEHARGPVNLATIETASLEEDDLLDVIIDRFEFRRIREGGGKAVALQTLRQGLTQLAKLRRRALLIVDEAHNLPHGAMEELRMLSNLQSATGPLLQTFLVGQPDLARRLQQPELEQLRQRVTASFNLSPFDRGDTEQYVRHRLTCVGWNGRPGFDPEAFDALTVVTAGIPRLINLICDRMLLFCLLEDAEHVTAEIVHTVAEETGMGGGDPVAGERDTAPWQGTPAQVPAEAGHPHARPTGDAFGLVQEMIDRLGRVESRMQQSELKLRMELARLRSVLERSFALPPTEGQELEQDPEPDPGREAGGEGR